MDSPIIYSLLGAFHLCNYSRSCYYHDGHDCDVFPWRYGPSLYLNQAVVHGAAYGPHWYLHGDKGEPAIKIKDMGNEIHNL